MAQIKIYWKNFKKFVSGWLSEKFPLYSSIVAESPAEILLDDGIPKQMWGCNPRTYFGDTWWEAERHAAFEAANNKCEVCDVSPENAQFHQWLEGHERYFFDYERQTMTYDRTYALCHSCHAFIHRGRLKFQVQLGNETESKLEQVIAHGELILKKEKLYNRYQQRTKPQCSEAQNWKLIACGQTIKPDVHRISA